MSKPTLREGEERRAFNFEFRAEGNEQRTITGYGALFNSLSENLGGFREMIKPGAFDDVLGDDVRALFNHDPNLILARSPGTMKLAVDSTGLRYEFDVGGQSYAQDLVESIGRGDITQSSFAFWVEEDSWDEDDDGRIIRTIIKIRRLYDVSPVTYPGYADTSVAARSLTAFESGRSSVSAELERRRRVLGLINA